MNIVFGLRKTHTKDAELASEKMNVMQDKQATESVTIKQLAKTLGMAHSTVSRALNGHPAISEATKKRIEDAAAQYGYVPNSAARILRRARSGVIGLVIPDIRNDFYTTVAKAIADAAAELSWQMVVATTDDKPERERQAVRSLLKAQAESVIIAPTEEPAAETVEMLKRLHTLQLLRHHPRIIAPAITVDDRSGIGLATRHLQELGHCRIGYIGRTSNVSTGQARLQGFLECFSDAQEAMQRVILFPPRAAYGASALRSLLSTNEPPTAIVLGSPEFASGVLEAASQCNLRIPDDFSLVAYGDSAWNRFLCGGLTTVSLPDKEIANGCVEKLRVRLGSPDASGKNHSNEESGMCFPTHLIVRDSTRKPAEMIAKG